MATCKECYYLNSISKPGMINEKKVVITKPIVEEWCGLMKHRSLLTDFTICELFVENTGSLSPRDSLMQQLDNVQERYSSSVSVNILE